MLIPLIWSNLSDTIIRARLFHLDMCSDLEAAGTGQTTRPVAISSPLLNAVKQQCCQAGVIAIA
jgi:hypothetical protein